MGATVHKIAVVGGGLAAAEAVKTLRGEGYDGRITLVADEPYLPYERPPLTKEYLRGDAGEEKLLAQPPDFYERADVSVLTGRRAVGLDAHLRRLTLDDGRRLSFDGLLLATGARAVRPAIEGADRPFVHLLRTRADADALRDATRTAGTAVVAGGGWVAAEAAASLRQMGLAVTLVVPGAEILEKHLGPAFGRILSDLHERHGVRLVRHARVLSVENAPAGRGLRLDRGGVVRGDLVVLGFGATPATELAEGAGLRVSAGVEVDEQLMTAAPAIYAAGDVAAAWSPMYGRRIRPEHWDTARRQGRTAARNLLGRREVYDRAPYFFSDQYELGLESIGLAAASDVPVLRQADGGVVALWLRDGHVTAGAHTNVWDAKATIARLVSAGAAVDPGAFADPSVPLESFGAEANAAASPLVAKAAT